MASWQAGNAASLTTTTPGNRIIPDCEMLSKVSPRRLASRSNTVTMALDNHGRGFFTLAELDM